MDAFLPVFAEHLAGGLELFGLADQGHHITLGNRGVRIGKSYCGAALDRGQPGACRKREVGQCAAHDRGARGDWKTLHEQLPTTELLQGNGSGVANRPGDRQGRKVLRAEQLVDAELLGIWRTPKREVGRMMHADDRLFGTCGLRHRSGQHIDLVDLRGGDQQITSVHTRFTKHVPVAAVAYQRPQVERIAQGVEALRREVDHGDVMSVGR